MKLLNFNATSFPPPIGVEDRLRRESNPKGNSFITGPASGHGSRTGSRIKSGMTRRTERTVRLKKLSDSGQTLVALVIYMVVAMTITLGAVAVSIINIRANSTFANGELALQYANDGVENALIQLERNSSYTGETMSINSGSATITVSGTTTKTIISVGSIGNFKRTVTATATDSSSIYTETSWAETP